VKNLTKDLKDFKKENLKLIETTRKIDINLSKEVVEANNGVSLIVIDSLKQRLNKIKSLYGKVSLLNNDNVMMIRGDKYIDQHKFSYCYERNDFNYIFNEFGLNDHKNIMIELLNKVSYHLYHIYLGRNQYYRFVFRLDMKNMKDIEVLIPHMFKMNILNKEIMVETLDERIICTYLREGYEIKLQPGKKLHLEQISMHHQYLGSHFHVYIYFNNITFK